MKLLMQFSPHSWYFLNAYSCDYWPHELLQFFLIRIPATRVVQIEYDCMQLVSREQWTVTYSHE
jgi:hypothetical protein